MDIDSLRSAGRTSLSEAEVKTLLREKGIKTTAFTTPKRSDLDTLEIDFPVVVKVCSPDVLHKSDQGGVFLDVRDRGEMISRYDDITRRFPMAEVLIEPMEKKGFEVIVGLTNDPSFGQCIMFGSGGVMANLIQDVSFRSVPIESKDAKEMIHETKARHVFEGFRGLKADLDSTVDLLVRVSEMGDELKDHLDQLDLNPVILYQDGYVVVDAKMVLR